MSNWKSATTNSEVWDGEGTIQGTYLSKKTNVGAKKSNMYDLKLEDGTTKSVWGSVIINDAFDNIPIGSLVRIKFVEKVRTKSGNEMKTYEIDYDDSDVANTPAPATPAQAEDIKTTADAVFPE